MTDLQINLALARAMGWGKLNDLKNDSEVFCWDVDHWRIFSYRNPVIFVAICKHWALDVHHGSYVTGYYRDGGVTFLEIGNIERAAAMVAIELFKRGVK